MAAEWGTWQDPVAQRQLDQYERHGFTLVTPEQHRASSPEKLGEAALSCNELLARMYGPNYPIDIHLQEAVETGSTHLFTLHSPQGQLAAMSALVEQPNPLEGDVRFIEIGRAVKDTDVMTLSHNPADKLSALGLLRMRAMRAGNYSPETDMLVSTTRTAVGRADMPSGYGIQRTWWGSNAKNANVQIPMVTTAAGYDYRIGRKKPAPEPFNSFMIPINPEQWGKDVNDFPLYMPPGLSASVVETLFKEATGGTVMPDIRVVNKRINVATAPFAVLQPPSDLAGGKYAITTNAPEEKSTSFEAVEAAFEQGAFSQKIIVEADVASTPKGAGVLTDLYFRGWSLAGWQPSALVRGGVCPVVARVHPNAVDQLVPAELAPNNFDAVGLAETREVLEHIYSTMKSQAEA